MENYLDVIEQIKQMQRIKQELIEELNEIENDRLIKQAQFILNYGAKCVS